MELAPAAGLSPRAEAEVIDEVVEAVGELAPLARDLDVDADVLREAQAATEACRARLGTL